MNRSRINQTIKNLEGVLKTSIDETQKRRVYKDIQRWKQTLKELPEIDEEEESIESGSSAEDHKDHLEHFEFLKHIPIQKINSQINNRELSETYTFISYFEDEYLGMLGEYHLKIDYNRADVRNTFYPKIHDLHSAMEHYAETLLRADRDSENIAKKSSYKLAIQEEYRNFIKKVGDFLHSLYKFVDELVEDYDHSGNLISNPHDKLKFDSSLDGKHVLEGCTVVEGLKDLHIFLTELIEYLNPPDMK